jgi:hypothetical protein
MWKSKALALALLAAAPLRADFMNVQREVGDLDARNRTIQDQRQRLRFQDPEELRAAIDDTQALFDSLAMVSGPLDAAAHTALFQDLHDGSKLPQAVDDARKALGYAEEAVKVKAGIKGQQARLAAAETEKDKDAEESRLLGLQSDLMGLLEDLRKRLRNLHKDLNEDQIRDLRNWAMVNEGILRRQQEEAAVRAAAQKESESLPISAGALSPQDLSATTEAADTDLTPTSEVKAKTTGKHTRAKAHAQPQ